MHKRHVLHCVGWGYYTEVPNLDAAIARATRRGAKVTNGSMEVSGGAHRAARGSAGCGVFPPSGASAVTPAAARETGSGLSAYQMDLEKAGSFRSVTRSPEK
jgi:hypothetical protein